LIELLENAILSRFPELTIKEIQKKMRFGFFRAFPELETSHRYKANGKYEVFDILGNDTTKMIEINV